MVLARRHRGAAGHVELLTEVGLPDPELMYFQYPFRLSGGQRQRVMIAMALALEPSVLIADEPTTALDVTTQAQIRELIRDVQRRKGMSVMFITHDFGVVAEIADSVVVMEKGCIVEQGSAEQVLKSPAHPYTKRLIAAVPRLTGEDRIPPGDRQQGRPILKVEGLRQDISQRQRAVRQPACRGCGERCFVRLGAWAHAGRCRRERLRQIVAGKASYQAPGQRRRSDPV